MSTPAPALKLGSRGTGVLTLRGKLAVHGYGRAGDPQSQVFDAQLRIAVRAFQADQGLVVDGIVGPKTWAALFKAPKLPAGEPTPPAAGHRRINEAGLELIARYEGCRHEVYLDPVGLPTVGIGHLLSAEERAKWPVGTLLSPAEVEGLFRADVKRFELAVAKAVKVPLSDNQFAALVSLAFNIGPAAFAGSTLLKRLNGGDYGGAALAFLRWNKAKGKVLSGLTKRRAAEKALFEK